MTPVQALAFVRKHGVVLESANDAAPNLAQAIAGENISGSWWAHDKANEIFRLTRYVRRSQEVLVCRLVGHKITYVHSRLWPALLRVADEFGVSRTCALEEVHTATGKHATKEIPIDQWVSPQILEASRALNRADAIATLPRSLFFTK